jgi:signal transduction histidine kinase/CheY-like chemotaxis protein/HPt (histidine-containing phosphotransfer) domain-containing protein
MARAWLARFKHSGGVRKLLLFMLLFLAAAAAVNSIIIVNRQHTLASVSRYNLTWLLSQAAHEVLRLEESVSASALPGGLSDADDVALRRDVVLNRLVLLQTGEAGEFLAARPDLKRGVDELASALKTIEGLTGNLPDPKVAAQIRAMLEPLVPKMLQMAAAANVRSGDIVAQDQHDLSLQHWVLTGLLVASAMVIVVMLYRFASAQQRSKADLEVAIDQRTAQLREALDYQTAVGEVLRVMSRSTFDITPVLQVVLETASRLCRAQMAALYRVQADGTSIWIAACGSGPRSHLIREAPPETAGWEVLVANVALVGRPLFVTDAGKIPGYGTIEIVGLGPARSLLGIPMLRDGKLMGALVLARDTVDAFSESQADVAMVFADQAAIAIDNVHLIDEIKDKSRQLEAALQHKSQFLANMSHELRTPMNGVLGMIDVLEAESPGPSQVRTLTIMRESAQVLLRNINDLLDYSRIEAGALRLEELPFDLKDLIDGTVEVFRPQAERKGLSLVGVVTAGTRGTFVGDATRVRQIIFNLLSNALKFTSHGGVLLRAGAQPGSDGACRVQLSVSDTGIGINGDEQSRLFKPFSQVDSSITRRFGGSGLGLSIVKQLVELMSGEVTVASVPGAGSIFTVTLSLKPASTEQTRELAAGRLPVGMESRAPASSSERMRGRVLVVDDNPVNCEVMLRQLELLGVEAEAAEDGEAGLDAWLQGDFNLILADVHMPGMDGYAMTARIRSRERQERRRRIPIVAVTADALAGEEARCRSEGMDDYIFKPLSLAQLREVVRRWLPERAPPAPAIDDAVLEQWVDNNPDVRRAILRKFVETISVSSRDIEQAITTGDLDGVRSAAHRLRSGALVVGAKTLSDSAALIESAARTDDRSTCEGHYAHLVAEMARVLAEIHTQVH